jgi:hypothetical protein
MDTYRTRATKEINDNLQTFIDPGHCMRNSMAGCSIKESLFDRMDKQRIQSSCCCNICLKHFSVHPRFNLTYLKPDIRQNGCGTPQTVCNTIL